MKMNVSPIIVSFVVCLFFEVVDVKVAPSYIKPCPVLTSECFKTNVQNTIPKFVKGNSELGIDSLDPLFQEQVDLTLPGNLKVQFHDGFVKGLRKCVVDAAKFENNVADLNLHCNITITGKYTAKGRLLIFPLNGDGDAKVKATNVQLNAEINFDNKIRDGVTYYEIKNYTVKHRFGDKVVFTLTELFNGNPELNETVLRFLNDNWRQVVEEFGDPIVNSVVMEVFKIVKKFFSVVPKNEIII